MQRATWICLAATVLCLCGRAPAADKKVVIPFDFISKNDEGRQGEMMGDMIWKKLEREKMFIIPETMGDVRDFCKSHGVKPGPDTPLETMNKIVSNDFGGHIGIWGSCEHVATETYDLVIKCVDFYQTPPKVIYECNVRTKSAAEVPHLYVKELMDKLCDRKPGEKPRGDPIEEENWYRNPNLITNGDFEKCNNNILPGWEPKAGQHREPLGNLVRWLPESGNAKNHVVRFTMSKGIAEGPGIMWYSSPFPVQVGSKYRFQCRYRTNGPSPKVFIKCYDELVSEWYREGESRTSAGNRPGEYSVEHTEPREVYRSQQNLKGEKNQWNTQTEDFTPKHTKYTPKFGRVMLYGYLKEGVVEWDDIVVKLILQGSPGDGQAPRRHSLETKVTIKEMEENERRSKDIKAKGGSRER